MTEAPTNAREATAAALAEIEAQIEKIRESLALPEVVYSKAPEVPIGETLSAFSKVESWAAWATRANADEAMSRPDVKLPHTAIADASGRGIATVNRWRARPLALVDADGNWGPATMTRWGSRPTS